jgi:protein TonB
LTAQPSHPLLTRSDDDRRVLWLALGVAVTLHLSVLLFVALPDLPSPVAPEPPSTPPNLTEWVIPPPEPERRRPPDDHRPERLLPAPDPDPERPEPIREAVHEEIEFDPPEDLPYEVGTPVAPPPATPFDLTHAEIVPPELILDSRVEPDFPELARVARHSGRVILRAVIDKEGSVVEIEMVDCTRPGFGFEEAATEAVRQWRYRPATLRGRPVPVYLVVLIEFKLH